MPFAFLGLLALFRRPERPLPEADVNGKGAPVCLALFSDEGRWERVAEVHKIARSNAAWREELTGEEYAVTRCKGTEFAFANRYWNNHAAGIYRCICCGTALFSSREKFDSGTGWPSFSAPMAKENVYTRTDVSLGLQRTEILCRKCDAHLGHVFDDGPPPSGMRYCLNSVALGFVGHS